MHSLISHRLSLPPIGIDFTAVMKAVRGDILMKREVFPSDSRAILVKKGISSALVVGGCCLHVVYSPIQSR